MSHSTCHGPFFLFLRNCLHARCNLPARTAFASVNEVAAFLESRDAGGLAQALQQNAVNGADLLGFGSYQEAAKDLNMTSFAARKLLSLRDAFLA